jgi:hypothetical protein
MTTYRPAPVWRCFVVPIRPLGETADSTEAGTVESVDLGATLGLRRQGHYLRAGVRVIDSGDTDPDDSLF